MINNINFHDVNIYGIFYIEEEETLELFLSNNKKLRFERVIHWDFSEFEKQNIIFDIKQYQEVPLWIKENFGIKKELPLNNLLCYIDSSVGLSGIIIYRNVKIFEDVIS
ncbi:hypothetical protein V6N22_000277 [Providencia stuartii]|uniref:Uncharacterized protein n=1 Tax=Providencia stuartii TaxID=588 RepID=A0AAJ1N2Z6_PROST|nr:MULTISPECIES: hypothetical protein [Providencia]EKT8195426.1 hypothetical protein [Klebsiella pneumoniae]EKW6535332.1 hypothetical protein [Proteus mirabilis]EKT8267139.1 hypothetical protein [Klebsiella pneumoniae]EKW9392089.1 hypothetical protein [Klebsiella pneumoniae]ELB5299668.1 hypothetical protein [Klebsiella pneumoniae]